MDEMKFKSDKQCVECRNQIRKDIITEVKEIYSGCKKINKIGQDKKHKIPKERHGRWT
jgi:hypothetical protein